MRPHRLRLVVVCLGLVGARCGHGPIEPTPQSPEVHCPADITRNGITGGSAEVHFASSPTVTGGSDPVSINCTRPSPSTYTLGTTTVTCVAIDHIGRQSSCSFTITLNAAVLAIKKFVAFGDSTTKGENGRPGLWGERFVDEPNSYPRKLEGLFASEFPDQGITVVNEGKGGEFVEDGLERLPGVLATDRPDALLLLDGYNNLENECPFGRSLNSACIATIDYVVSKLREMIRTARGARVQYVFVSTLTPPGSGVVTIDRRIASEAIVHVNDGIRRMVLAEGAGAVLSDPYPLFLGHEAEYVDEDGLHLRPAGNQVLAETFFAAIKKAIPAAFGSMIR